MEWLLWVPGNQPGSTHYKPKWSCHRQITDYLNWVNPGERGRRWELKVQRDTLTTGFCPLRNRSINLTVTDDGALGDKSFIY